MRKDSKQSYRNRVKNLAYSAIKEHGKKHLKIAMTKLRMVKMFKMPRHSQSASGKKNKNRMVNFNRLNQLAHSNDIKHFQNKGIRDQNFINMIKESELELKKVDKIPPLSAFSTSRSQATRMTSAMSKSSRTTNIKQLTTDYIYNYRHKKKRNRESLGMFLFIEKLLLSINQSLICCISKVKI